MNNTQKDTFDRYYTYRDVSVQVWNTNFGQQKVVKFINDPIFNTCDIYLDSFDTQYEKFIQYLIDDKLDTIRKFDCDAKLRWFQNGDDWDIQLVYKQRVLKIWLVKSRNTILNDTLEKIIKESEENLKKYLQNKKTVL